MRYLYIPVALIVIFIIYLLHTLFVEKDKKKFKSSLAIGLFFIVAWALIYYLIL